MSYETSSTGCWVDLSETSLGRVQCRYSKTAMRCLALTWGSTPCNGPDQMGPRPKTFRKRQSFLSPPVTPSPTRGNGRHSSSSR